MKILITDGAGFIGSAVIRHLIRDTAHSVVNVDKLTYAGNLASLGEAANIERHAFEHVDICDADAMRAVFDRHLPDAVMYLAAESHVDRSIHGPADFLATNLVGTGVLLEAARAYWEGLDETLRAAFRFHHVSTDEVYGDLEGPEDLFTENTPYAPSSPIRPARPGRTTWYAPGSAPLVCRCWLPTALTTRLCSRFVRIGDRISETQEM